MDWSKAIQKAVGFAAGRASPTLGEFNALVPSGAKTDDIDVLLAGLCDRGVWLTDAKRSADDAR